MACGHCIACRINAQREWTVRNIHELSYWDEAVFVTLTYDDEHLPWENSLYRYELQNFLKRLRKEISPRKIKYFACGEYGDLRGRPHYHLIIYGMGFQKDDWKHIFRCWGRGHIKLGSVTHDSIQYVCGYVMKKYNGAVQKEKFGDRWPQFMACSKGIGEQWINDNYKKVTENLTVTYRGNALGIPRYYRSKLGDSLDLGKYEAARKERSDKRLEEMIEVVGDRLSVTTALIDGRRQSEEQLKTKSQMSRRKL